MTYIELQFENFNEESLNEFWGAHLKAGFREISINIDTETGSISSIEKDWQEKTNLPSLGVRMNIVSLASRWNDLAESNINDHQYDALVKSEAGECMRSVLRACPSSIIVLRSMIDRS
jgi:hypothetical protein